MFAERTVKARVTPKIAAANFSGSSTSARYSDAIAAISKGLPKGEINESMNGRCKECMVVGWVLNP